MLADVTGSIATFQHSQASTMFVAFSVLQCLANYVTFAGNLSMRACSTGDLVLHAV